MWRGGTAGGEGKRIPEWCVKYLLRPDRSPLTNRPIKPNGATQKRLLSTCRPNKMTVQIQTSVPMEISCRQFLQRPLVARAAAWPELIRRCGLPKKLGKIVKGSRIPNHNKDAYAIPFGLEVEDIQASLKLAPLKTVLRPFIKRYKPQSKGYFGFDLRSLLTPDPLTTASHWQGYATDLILGLLTILALSKNTCIGLPPRDTANLETQKVLCIVSAHAKRSRLVVPMHLRKQIDECPHQLMVLRLTLERGDLSHANLLLLDFRDMVVSRLEPFGTDSPPIYLADKLDRRLKRFFNKLDYRWKYVGTTEMCPRMGLQIQQFNEHITVPNSHGGFCGVWTLYFMHMRLLHPHINRNRLLVEAGITLTLAVKQGRLPNLTAFIAGYATALQLGGLYLLNVARGRKQTPKIQAVDDFDKIDDLLNQHLFTILAHIRRR